MGKRACSFSSVAVRMLGYISRCEGAQGWAYRLMGQSVYGVRMSRWIRCVWMYRCVAVRMPGYVRGFGG